MRKRKSVPPVVVVKLPPISLRIISGTRADFNAVFHTLTTPYTGHWYVRGYCNNALVWENAGGQREINLYFEPVNAI